MSNPTIPQEQFNLKKMICCLMKLETDEINDSTSLIEQGLDSITLMRIPLILKEHGYQVTLNKLLENPTVLAWNEILIKSSGKILSDKKEITYNEKENLKLPLTPIQQAYIVGRRDDQPLGDVGCHLYCEFDGKNVNSKRLENAIKNLCDHHPILRSIFYEDGYQQILSVPKWNKLIIHDLSMKSIDNIQVTLKQLRENLSHRKLNVFDGEVFDVQLTYLPNNVTRIHLNIDLLVADVLSITIFLRDLANLYNGYSLPEIPASLNFQSYVQSYDVNKDHYENDKSYWSERIRNLAPGEILPLNKNPDIITKPKFTRREFWLSHNEINLLQRKAKVLGLTISATFASAFSMILLNWSESKSFLLNIPLFNRKEGLDNKISNVIANFTNLILVEIKSSGNNFVEFTQQLQKQMHKDIAHSSYSGVEVLRDLKRININSSAPIVLACNFNELFLTPLFENTLGKLEWSISQTPQVWIDHQIYNFNKGFLLNWDSVDELFPEKLLDSMFGAYKEFIYRLINEDWFDIKYVELPEEQKKIRHMVNSTQTVIDNRLLHELFINQSRLTPNSGAICWSTGKWSYEELYYEAKKISTLLINNGAHINNHIAVILPKGPEQISSILGILMIGAVYVPIAIDSPSDRLNRILLDSDCNFAITTLSKNEITEWPDKVIRIHPNAQETQYIFNHNNNEYLVYDSTNIAYIIYTSGSTGEPKGVMIDHQGAINTILDINRRWNISSKDIIFGISSLSFDLSVYDIFGTLSSGATLILPDENGLKDPAHWYDLLIKFNVTIWNSVPALIGMLLEYTERFNHELPKNIRLALLSGDWIPLNLPKRLKHIRVISLGGATEASIWSNYYEIDKVEPHWVSIPYGFPLANQEYHVLNNNGLPCPDWVPGDLYISGLGLAHGYWNDQDKTDLNFITGWNGKRIYKTGDRARYWPNGILEFLGRKDQQVKIGGYRIELGEIDAALTQIEGIMQAVSVVRTSNGKSSIISYITLDPPFNPVTSIQNSYLFSNIIPTQHPKIYSLSIMGEFKAKLAHILPSYMIPRFCLILENMPLTSNGKIDRFSLPDVSTEKTVNLTSNYLKDNIYDKINKLWCDNLNITSIEPEDDFFELGGDSLLAIRVISEVSKLLDKEISVRFLYESPILCDFVNHIINCKSIE